MDPSTAVRTDTLPAIATIVVPGTIASAGYVWLGLGVPAMSALEVLRSHEWVSAIAFVLISVGVGFVVDSAGSYLEVYGLDRRRADHDEMIETWWRYLTMALPEPPPIGHSYIRRILVSFKFELNICVALGLALPTVPALVVYDFISWWRGLATSLLLICGVALAYFAARGSSSVLADARQRLVGEGSNRTIPGQ